MKNQQPVNYPRKAMPIIVAAMLGLTACSAEQAGDTNGGLVGGVGGINGATALGVVGGVALAGLLLSSDDDDAGTANGSDGATTGGIDSGDGTGTGGTDGGTGTGGTDGGTGTGGTDGGTGTGGTDGGTGTGGTDGGTDTGGTDGGTGTGGTDGGTDTGGTDGGTGTGGTDGGGTGTDNGPGGTGSTNVAGEGFLTNDGLFQEDLIPENVVPPLSSTGFGNSNLTFDRNTGQASGTVTLTNVDADRVDLMVGPPGSNGFVAVALENLGGGVWTIPASLSAQQTAFVLQNINSGNLYLAASSSASPNGLVRRQLLPGDVLQYRTSVSGVNGGSAQGYALVNQTTGDYSITWNTSDLTLANAHINDGVVSGATENDYAPLTQRTSNPARFFRDGNFTDPADPLYPDLLERLNNGTVWLDAHSTDDTRVFFGQLSAAN